MWFIDSAWDSGAINIFSNYCRRSLSSSNIRTPGITVRPAFVIDLSEAEYVDTQELFIK